MHAFFLALTLLDPAPPLWDAAAVALVMAPDMEWDDLPTQIPPGLADAIERFSAHAELWDPAAPRSLWAWENNARGNILWARSMWVQHREDPPIADAQRLPPYDHSVKLAKCAWSYASDLSNYRNSGFCPAMQRGELDDTISEATALATFWSAVSNASNASNCWTTRREALRMIRNSLDRDDYISGRMLPCLPFWRLPYAR